MTAQQLDVAKLAVAYKRLVLWFGAQLVIALGGPAVMPFVSSPETAMVIALARLLGVLVTVAALGFYAYRTASALGSNVGVRAHHGYFFHRQPTRLC